MLFLATPHGCSCHKDIENNSLTFASAVYHSETVIDQSEKMYYFFRYFRSREILRASRTNREHNFYFGRFHVRVMCSSRRAL